MTTKLLLQALATLAGGVLGLWLLLFLTAGTTDYWQAWVFVPVFMITMSGYGIYFSIKDPAHMERRKQGGPGAEQSILQKIIVTVGLASLVGVFVLSALDHRFGWSQVPPLVSWIGNMVLVLSFVLYYLVGRENTWAAANIRVEEGQRVVSTGPYALVRHPKYDGDVLMVLSIPLALGSWRAVAFLPITIMGLAVRILDEERTLARDLPGYSDYLRKVRFRLVPRVW